MIDGMFSPMQIINSMTLLAQVNNGQKQIPRQIFQHQFVMGFISNLT